MTNKKWAVLLVLISIPLSYYGFSNFEEGASEPLQAILISLACTGGVSCLIGGIYMLFKKGRGEDLLASQTKVGISPIQKTINKPSKKVNEMTEAKDNVDSIKTLDEYNEKMKKLFKREDELKTRKKEVTKLDKEIDNETTEVPK